MPSLCPRLRLIPRTLAGRVSALFGLSILVFACAGLGMFYRLQFMQHVADTQDNATTLVEVASQAVDDGALIGDYDTVERTLAKMMIRSPFKRATFTDLNGGVIGVDAEPEAGQSAPEWLVRRVGSELEDIRRPVAAGGKDYGVLRLAFDERKLAAELWGLALQTSSLAAIAVVLALALSRWLLARWLHRLDSLRFYTAGALEDGADVVGRDTPLEIREAILAVNRSAASMRDQYGQRIDTLMHSLVQHKRALDQAAIVCELDRDGRVTAVNEQFVRRSGYPREQLVGRTLARLGGGWSPSSTVWRGEVALPAAAGECQWYRTIVPIVDHAGGVEKYICIDFDISERKQFEDAIVRNAMRQGLLARLGRKALEAGPLEELFAMAARLACDGLGVYYAALFGFDLATGSATPHAAVGFPASAVGVPFAHAAGPASGDRLGAWSARVLGATRAGSGIEAFVVCSDRLYGALGVYAPAQRTFQEDEEAFLNSLANILASAVEREDARSRLTWLAQFDTLTGLPNRRRLAGCLEDAIAGAADRDARAGVMFIDLDRFKSVNDMLGHSAGDQLLVEAGRRLQACVGAHDVVARLGGDEFAVVLPCLGAQPDYRLEAEPVARRIVDALAQPFTLQGQQLFVSASVGIAAWPDDGMDADALLKSADTAMYSAKNSGRNNYQFYVPAMNADAALRLQTEHQLHLALKRGEFELHYQPKLRLTCRAVTGFEALLRWRHPQRGLVAPAEFISILEETGMILAVGEWVIGEVCRQLRAWSAEAGGELAVPPVAINLSARQLGQAGFAETVRAIVQGAGVDPGLLEFELTESMLMADPEAAVTILRSLKAQGMRLSVDDFGTGYSSLAYLKRFPLDALKIDRTFVRDLPADSEDAAITKAVISLAHSLNLKVVAEGVETAGHLRALEAYGCDEIQGYYISRPLPADACMALLAQGVTAVAAA
ncbi:EAL domain-containing protein [Massilia sp. SYSU DXS3249]